MSIRKILVISIFVALGFLTCKTAKGPIVNSIDNVEKVILKKEGFDHFFYWELKDEKSLWDFDTQNTFALNQYRDSLKLVLGSSLFESAVKKESIQNLHKDMIVKEENGDKINALLIHTGSVGKVRKMNHLESQILNAQIKRFPMLSHPTEFHGFIVQNKDEGLIRVYVASSNTEWPPHPNIILQELRKESSQGWELIQHLHNHYCKEDENYIGILAPSLADAQYYKMLKEQFNLELALITNGFHTVEISNKDFDKFESH